MKLIMAIIGDDDSFAVIDSLSENGFYVTKLATTGGLFRSGNTTLICGTPEERIPDLVQIIEKKCKSRRQITSVNSQNIGTSESYVPYPVEVTTGGAVIFVLNVEEFKKV